jgi:Cu-processing system ATP-binding protein
MIATRPFAPPMPTRNGALLAPPPPRAPAPIAVQVSGLRKRFGRLTVLDGLDLSIRQGEVTAVLGPNGAGKTTLIKSILGLVRPDAGEICVGGEPVGEGPEYRARIGYMPQIARYPENLTPRELVRMLRDLRGDTAEVDERLVEALRLGPELDKPFRTLSGGNRQKTSAVLAFLFRPDVLFLDEPSAGLDPVASSVLKDRILAERTEGRTVILTSHILAEVQELAERVVYLLDGRILFDAPVAGLLAASGEATLERAIARRMEEGSAVRPLAGGLRQEQGG